MASADQRNDIDRVLEEIRRETVEARNLVIKTDNQLKNVQADLKAMYRRYEESTSRQWVASGVAYVLFAALAVAAAWFVVRASGRSAHDDQAKLEARLQDAAKQLETLQRTMAARDDADQRIAAAWRGMQSESAEDRLKAAEASQRIEVAALAPWVKSVLTEKSAAIRGEVGTALLDKGRAAFRRGEYSGALDELRRASELLPDAVAAGEASLLLGNALVQLKRYDEAIPSLLKVVSGDKRVKGRDFAAVLLIQAYDATGQSDAAATVAKESAAAYGAGEFGGVFRTRIARRTPSGGRPASADGGT